MEVASKCLELSLLWWESCAGDGSTGTLPGVDLQVVLLGRRGTAAAQRGGRFDPCVQL